MTDLENLILSQFSGFSVLLTVLNYPRIQHINADYFSEEQPLFTRHFVKPLLEIPYSC